MDSAFSASNIPSPTKPAGKIYVFNYWNRSKKNLTETAESWFSENNFELLKTIPLSRALLVPGLSKLQSLMNFMVATANF